MNDSQDDFSPMLVDRQIENPDALLSPSDAHFIHNMRALFERETSASIEKGWQKLMRQRASGGQPAEVLNFSTHKQHNGRASIMDERTMLSTPTQVARKKRLPRLLGQIAAILVCIALVGGLMLTLNVARNKPASTSVASGGPQTSSTTLAATPTQTIPAACKDKQDLAEQTLCAMGEETNINITRSFTSRVDTPQGKVSGSGTVNVTFHRAYADLSRLILVYTINQAPTADWGGLMNLSTNQGTLSSSESSLGKGSFTQSFDTSGLPASTTQLRIQAINTANGVSVPLAFTLPFHTASKTVKVEQTRTGKGYTLTLKRLVLTNSLATFAFTLKYQQSQVYPPAFQIVELTINGQKQTIVPGNPMGTGESHQPGVENDTRTVAQSLLGQSGSWTIALSVTSTNPGPATPLGTATFTFTVPA